MPPDYVDPSTLLREAVVGSIHDSPLDLVSQPGETRKHHGEVATALVARIARGERWYSAHRSHAYQWLSRRWGSHARVTGLFILVNVGLVLPAAWWTVLRPQHGPLVAAVVLVSLGVAARAAGAGRPEAVASQS